MNMRYILHLSPKLSINKLNNFTVTKSLILKICMKEYIKTIFIVIILLLKMNNNYVVSHVNLV